MATFARADARGATISRRCSRSADGLDAPRPFSTGLLLGAIAAAATALAWFADTPTFSLMGEPPDQMGWQILAVAVLVSIGLGGLVTKSSSVLLGPSKRGA